MANIQLLPDTLINQIAAGEVIEGPLSVVKELVENAIDAKATSVVIEIEAGGFGKIAVHDNGEGIAQRELPLAIQRHATSKLFAFSDLFSLHTLGFRGEALASIASVSHMHISSCKEGEDPYLAGVEGGKITTITPSSRQRGTTITVTDLFYNVAVRRKFQKDVDKCRRQIVHLCQQFALSSLDIHFSLIADGKEIFHMPIEKRDFFSLLKKRAEIVFGPKRLSSFLKVSYEEAHFSLKGFISPPKEVKTHRLSQHLFINQRIIQAKEVAEVIELGYGTKIAEGAHPLFVLHFFLPPENIDVNVHPQKKNARFEKTPFWKDPIKEAIENALQRDVKTVEKKIFFQHPQKTFKVDIDHTAEIFSSFVQEELLTKKEVVNKRPEPICLLGRFFLFRSLYLDPLFSTSNALYVMDCKRAYTSLLFAKGFERREHSSQKISPPIEIEGIEEQYVQQNHYQMFHQVGFSFYFMTPEIIKITAIPSFLKREQAEQFFQEAYDLLRREKELFLGKKLAKQVMHLAKDFSLTSIEEAMELFSKLLESQEPFFDPLGYSIINPITEEVVKQWMKKS